MYVTQLYLSKATTRLFNKANLCKTRIYDIVLNKSQEETLTLIML